MVETRDRKATSKLELERLLRRLPDPPRVAPDDAGGSMDRRMPKYLRPKAVAERYSMSVPTLYRWLADGKIAGVTKPGMTLISVESVEQYLATWKQQGTVSRGPKTARVER